MVFLDQFFPATKRSALRKEIQGTTQEYDETLSQYWSRYMGKLDACPNNHMSEGEIYSFFYEGMNAEGKDLLTSSSGGGFAKLRVSEAKKIIERLLDVKRAHDDPHVTLPRKGTVNATTVTNEDHMQSQIDKLEKALLWGL